MGPIGIEAVHGFGPRFWRIWTASTVSTLGDGIRYVAFPLIATGLTRDPRSITLVAAAGYLPWLLFGLIGGAVVDRFDRRVLMWTIDFTRALIVGALAVAAASGHISIVALTAVTFLLGTVETVFDNAASSIVPTVVADNRLESANSWLFATQTAMSTFIGAPIGGLLFAIGDSVPLTVDAVSFVAAAAIVLRLPGRYLERSATTDTSIRVDVIEGLVWLWRSPVLRILCLMLCAINLTFAAAEAVLVLYALEVLRLGNFGYALLLVAFAVGGLLGTVIAPAALRALGGRTVVAISVVALAIGLLVLALTSNTAVTAAMLVLVGGANMLWGVPTMTLRQRIVPPVLLGRVTSAYRVVGIGLMPIGAAAAGAVAHRYGLHAPYLVSAVLVAVVALIALPRLRWPEMRPDAQPASA